MNVQDHDKVVNLIRRRQAAITLHDAARDGAFPSPVVWRNGEKVQVFDVVNEAIIRSAVIEEAANQIVALNKELLTLGVGTPKFELADMDAAGWRRTCEMYLRAWIRELGGRLIPKWHLIDALVLTTREQHEKALKWDAYQASLKTEEAAA